MDVRWDAREQQVEGGLGVSLGHVTREEVFEDLGTGMAGSQGGMEGWTGRRVHSGGLETCWVGSKCDLRIPGLGDLMNSAWRLQEQVKGTVRNAPGPEADYQTPAEFCKGENAHSDVLLGAQAIWLLLETRQMFAAKAPAPQGPQCPGTPAAPLTSLGRAL